MQEAARILLIDDHEVFRIGLKQIIAEALPVGAWGEAANEHEALRLLTQRDWEMVILELALNGNPGLELLKDIKSTRPKVPILVVTGRPEKHHALRAIKGGAAGYITKASTSTEFIRAIRKVLQGGLYVSGSFAETLSADFGRNVPEPIHDLLSDREFQVLRLIGSGKTVGEIAGLLTISDKTVSTYRARILDKTGLKNNAEVVRYAVEHRLID